MQIVVRHDSGLGNQLFQYAAGRYYANSHGGSLRIAIDHPANLVSQGLPRPFLLSKFNVSATCSQINSVDRLLTSVSPKIALATKPIRSTVGIQVVREAYPQRHIFDRSLIISKGTRLAYLVGHWQCHPPAQMVEPDLRRELSFREKPQGKNNELVRKIQSVPTPVSLHIRRGDYTVVFPDWVLPPEYYLKAMGGMKDRFGNPTFFLFSDDPGFAHHLAAKQQDCIVVDHNDAMSAHEDLRLMSLCHHHIIANSTFSWWGAWLNAKKDKTVIAPSKWLEFKTNQIEIALPTWNLL